MKKTKEMFPGGFYLLRGQSSANSSFIEDKEEAKKFIFECNKRLSGFAIIHDFLLTKDGWLLLISLLDESTIKKNYRSRWKGSRKVKKESFLDVVWKIISEQIRQIRFTFVLYSNRKNGREGSKVKKSYERFWFETLEEAEGYILKMKKQLIKLSQRLKTYRSKKKHYRISKSEGGGSIFLCSLDSKRCIESVVFAGGCYDLRAISSDVLRLVIDSTISMHFHHANNTSTCKLE